MASSLDSIHHKKHILVTIGYLYPWFISIFISASVKAPINLAIILSIMEPEDHCKVLLRWRQYDRKTVQKSLDTLLHTYSTTPSQSQALVDALALFQKEISSDSSDEQARRWF